MKKFERSTLDMMKPDDHFYFFDDTKKIVQELIRHTPQKAYLYTAYLAGSERYVAHKKGFQQVRVVFLNSKAERKQ